MARFKRRFRRFKKKCLTKCQSKAVAKIAKKVLHTRQEFKQHAESVAETEVYDGIVGVLQNHLTSITQNLGDTTRTGDEIYIERIELMMNFTMAPTAAGTQYCHFRVIVFQYFSNDDSPSIAELFLTSNLNGGVEYGTYSAFNIDNKPVYRVLLDKMVRCEYGNPNSVNWGNTGLLTQFRRWNVPLRRAVRKIQYRTASDNANNGIWIMVTTNLAGITDNPAAGYQCNILYTDS